MLVFDAALLREGVLALRARAGVGGVGHAVGRALDAVDARHHLGDGALWILAHQDVDLLNLLHEDLGVLLRQQVLIDLERTNKQSGECSSAG